MNEILEAINEFYANIVPIGDAMWGFPRNFEWYKNIPILGNFTFAVLLLLGIGIYFSLKFNFVQFKFFKRGIKSLMKKKRDETGVTPLAAFMLSTAMRVGPGNIIGVTGAISVGGPGALFWMWMSALLGMASSFVESTLSQIFKEKDDDEFVGGLPYYGQKLLGNKKWVGIVLSLMFITYALLSIPIQTFHTFTATGKMASLLTGNELARQSSVYYILALIIFIGTAIAVFGGIKRVTAVTDKMVPVMAVVYSAIALFVFIINITKFPGFIGIVVMGAFKPDSVFGGAFGVALSQGIKRGLLSNEAGQGTITMSAAVSEQDHPCDQGFIQSLGVFLDTIIICTFSGFIVVTAKIWEVNPDQWSELQSSKIDVFLTSVSSLIPGTAADATISIIICLCYALFAFTCLLGLISFAAIAGTRISKSKKCVNIIRIIGSIICVPFGILCVLSGLELDNIWWVSDIVNISLVFANAPIIIIGSKYVLRALKDYKENDGGRFVADSIGLKSDVWNESERIRIEKIKKIIKEYV